MPKSPKEKILPRCGWSIVIPEVAQTLHGKSKICVFTTQQISGLENEVKTSKPMREEALKKCGTNSESGATHLHEDDKQTSRTIFYPLSDTFGASTM